MPINTYSLEEHLDDVAHYLHEENMTQIVVGTTAAMKLEAVRNCVVLSQTCAVVPEYNVKGVKATAHASLYSMAERSIRCHLEWQSSPTGWKKPFKEPPTVRTTHK